MGTSLLAKRKPPLYDCSGRKYNEEKVKIWRRKNARVLFGNRFFSIIILS